MITHDFKTIKRRKIVIAKAPIVFGIAGVARSGKDTLAKYIHKKLEKNGTIAAKISFASAVKIDLDVFLKEKLNISAFTEKTEEKNIIRPLLVAYGTDVCRNNIDKDFWVKKIQKRVETNIKNNIITIIPDVRYKNEIQWIKNLGGYVIHVSRCGIEPANLEEKANDPIVEKLSDYKLKWKNFSDEKKTCTRHVAELFRENGWSLYGKFK